MPLTIHGLNAGVIRHDNDFAALALKIKHEANNDSLLFVPLLPLKDLLLCLEYHLPVKSVPDDAGSTLHSNAPALVEDELRNADVRLRVEGVTLLDDTGNSLTIAFTLNTGETLTLNIADTQIPALVKLIYQYKNTAGEIHTSGSVIKTRSPSASQETQGIVKRLLRFSNRLRKLDHTPCKVFVRTLAAGNKVTLTQAQCLHAVHNLRLHVEKSAA